MAAKISDVLRKEGHPGYAIDVAALENLVVNLRKTCEDREKASQAYFADVLRADRERDHYRDALELIAHSTVNVGNRGACALVDIALAALGQ